MDSDDHQSVPELANASPMRISTSAGVVGLLMALLLFSSGTLYLLPGAKADLRPPPSTAEELSTNVVTVIPSEDTIGIKSAIAAIDAPEASRIEIERAVLSLKRQMGWIVFTDSMDPDGDVVAVRASGLTQQVTLTKAWTPVAVPISAGSPIEVTGVKDGLGGGITVALATQSGPVVLRALQPGEKLEIMP
jgi:hypothetical protein